jgi:hypothetical protein
MNARTLRHDWPGGRAGLGLLGILLILGLGCGSNPPAAQEPTPGPETASEPGNEPVNESAPSTPPDSPGVAEDAPAAEPEQASVPQPEEPDEEPVAEPSGKLLQLIQDSEEAGRQGLSGKSHRLCSQALDMDSRQPRALMVCAIAACNLRNKRLAKKYYALLETEEQQGQIYQICTSRRIDVRE